MVQNSHSLSHYEKEHPHKIGIRRLLDRFIDRFIYVVIFIGPVMTIPQITNIWVDKNAAGVSAASWMTYLFIAVFWFAYGISHRNTPIIVTNAIWIVMETIIVIGIFLYG